MGLAAERALETAGCLDPGLGAAAGELAALRLDGGDPSRAHALRPAEEGRGEQGPG